MDDPYHRLRSVVDGDARIVKKSFAVVIESGTAEGEERRDANARAIVIAIVIMIMTIVYHIVVGSYCLLYFFILCTVHRGPRCAYRIPPLSRGLVVAR